MDAAVVEFDALADAIGPAAQHHDFSSGADAHCVGGVVGGKIVSRVFHAADRDGFPTLSHADGQTLSAEIFLADAQQHGQVAIGKPVLLGLPQQRIGQFLAFIFANLLFQLNQFFHLLDEPALDVGSPGKGFHIGALTQGLIHDELSLAGGFGQKFHEIFERFFMKIFCKSKPVAPLFE